MIDFRYSLVRPELQHPALPILPPHRYERLLPGQHLRHPQVQPPLAVARPHRQPVHQARERRLRRHVAHHLQLVLAPFRFHLPQRRLPNPPAQHIPRPHMPVVALDLPIPIRRRLARVPGIGPRLRMHDPVPVSPPATQSCAIAAIASPAATARPTATAICIVIRFCCCVILSLQYEMYTAFVTLTGSRVKPARVVPARLMNTTEHEQNNYET